MSCFSRAARAAGPAQIHAHKRRKAPEAADGGAHGLRLRRLIANGPATFGIDHETLRKWARNSEPMKATDDSYRVVAVEAFDAMARFCRGGKRGCGPGVGAPVRRGSTSKSGRN